MTVKELKEKLNQFDENLPIHFRSTLSQDTGAYSETVLFGNELDLTIEYTEGYEYDTMDEVGDITGKCKLDRTILFSLDGWCPYYVE